MPPELTRTVAETLTSSCFTFVHGVRLLINMDVIGGQDLNIVSEFPENVKNEQYLKEDAAVILQRYTKFCQNFLLVTDDGRFAGRWIYYGLTPLQMRDLATERRKLVRTADPVDRSSDILEGPVGVGGDGETVDTVDDTDSSCSNLYSKD